MTKMQARHAILVMLGVLPVERTLVVYHGGREGGIPMLFGFVISGGSGHTYVSVRVSYSGSPWAVITRPDGIGSHNIDYRWVLNRMNEHLHYQERLRCHYEKNL
jgi:hypothetical protein